MSYRHPTPAGITNDSRYPISKNVYLEDHVDTYSVDFYGATTAALTTAGQREQNAADIQGCIDAAHVGALESGMTATVNVPGFYQIGTPLVHRFGVKLTGNGFITGASGFQQYGSGPVISMDTEWARPHYGLEVAHLKLVGNLDDTSTGDGYVGIETGYGSTNCHWHDLLITKCGRDGMRFVQSNNTPRFGPLATGSGTSGENHIHIANGTANLVIDAATTFHCDGNTYTVNGTPVTLDANGAGTLTLTGNLATSPTDAAVTYTENTSWHQQNSFSRIYIGDGSTADNACQGHAFYAEGGFSTNTLIDLRCVYNPDGIKMTGNSGGNGLWMPVANTFITPFVQAPNLAEQTADTETHGIDLYDCHATTIINPYIEGVGMADTTAASSCIHQDGAKSSGLNIMGGLYSASPNIFKIDDGGGVCIGGSPIYHWNGSNPVATPTYARIASAVDTSGVTLMSPPKKLSATLTSDITMFVDTAGRANGFLDVLQFRSRELLTWQTNLSTLATADAIAPASDGVTLFAEGGVLKVKHSDNSVHPVTIGAAE